MAPQVTLRAFAQSDIAVALPWFADPDSDLFAGGAEMLERELATARDGVYVGELDGLAVAIVSTISFQGPAALVNPLVVAPGARGRGVGRAVLAALAALSEFDKHVFVANVETANPGSVRCFEAAGYKRIPARSDRDCLRLERSRDPWATRERVRGGGRS